MLVNNNNNQHLEIQGISINNDDAPLYIYNVYSPPTTLLPRGYTPDLNIIIDNFPGDTLICGDWNSHHFSWNSAWEDDRGDAVATAIDGSDLCVLNTDEPTRLPSGNQCASSPDISLISAHLALNIEWSVSTSLSSDHLPILICFDNDSPLPHLGRTFTNYKRANWPAYRDELMN